MDKAEDTMFSWKRAMKHAFLLALLLTMGGMILALVSQDATKAGEVTARIVRWVFPLVLLASYCYQTSKRIPLVLVSVLIATLVALSPALVARAKWQGTISMEDRQPLRRAEGAYCHDGLGFSLPDPGEKFEIDPSTQEEVNAILSKEEGLFAWVLGNSDTGERIVVHLAKGVPGRDQAVREFIEAMKNRLSENLGVSPDVDQLRLVGEHWTYDFGATLSNGVKADLHCLWNSPDQAPAVVCVQTGTLNASGFADVRERLAWKQCPL
jgi:hypothetical protein